MVKTAAMGDYAKKMTAKKSCTYSEYGSFFAFSSLEV